MTKVILFPIDLHRDINYHFSVIARTVHYMTSKFYLYRRAAGINTS